MACYLCQHSDFLLRKGAVRDDPSLSIRECVQCGLVTLSTVQHIQSDHYENSGMHGDALPAIAAWQHESEQDDQRRFEMLKAGLVNRRILDFGCGAGGFLGKAQTLASEVVGVEPERRVKEHLGGQIELYGGLEDAGDGFDLITAFHVIEHLANPRLILKELATRLTPTGRMVIEVPSSEDALLTLYENDAFSRFTYWSQHLFLFNTETLSRLAVQAGLRVVAVQQFQRYPLSNHLYWLSRNLPGGHQQWSFLDSPILSAAYAASLAALGKCDTLIAYLEKCETSE